MTKDTIYSGVVNGTGYTQFKNLVGGLNTNGGTNYDTAIEAANSVLWNDADPVYVIFVTDGDTVSRGYLAYDSTGATDHAADWDGGTYYNGDSTQTTAQYYARARSAAQIQLNKLLANSNNKFYSIGVFGTVQYLRDLGGTYLGQANDQDAIEQAFSTIISEIALELGYKSVTVHDGITALTSTALVNGTVDQFRYTVTTKAGVTTEYANGAELQAAYLGIGLASYNSSTKTVEWNMGSDYMLEDGVTYTVSFTVWPSQDAYDYLADFNNKVKYITKQDASVKKQFVVEVGGSTYQFVENKGWTTDIPAKETSTYITDDAIQSLIAGASNVTHYLKTNTSASLDYTYIKTDGTTTQTQTVTGAEIRDPNGKMILDPSEMKVEKAFAHYINAEDPFARIQFYLKVDGKYYNTDGSLSDTIDTAKVYTIDLPTADSKWYDNVYIAPGLIKTVNGTAQLPPLENGHDYTLEEVILEGDAYEYGFTPQTVRPMVIGNTGTTFLVLKDKYNTNPNGATEYTIDGKTYYVDTSSNGLIGTNRKTGELDITKMIVDKTGNFTDAQLDAETFTYRVTLTVPADADISGITAYEYVARYDDAVNNDNRYTIFGYQNSEIEAVRGVESDVKRFSGKTYGGYTVTTSTANRQMTDMFTGSGDTKTATIDITLKRNEIIRFTNLPEGTTYEITEMYNNYRQADPSRDADAAGSTMAANIADQGYTTTIATKSRNPVSGVVGTGSLNGMTVTGTIDYLDVRYYNQFTNTLDEAIDIELKGTKHLAGYEWSNERYYFNLSTTEENTPLPVIGQYGRVRFYLNSASGTDDKTYSFGKIRFTEAGTYTYTIAEDNAGTLQMINGTAVQFGGTETFVIKVVEDTNTGKLVVESVTNTSGNTEWDEVNRIVNTTITNTANTADIHLKKITKGTTTILPGAEFKLYRKNSAGIYTTDETIEATKEEKTLVLTDGTLDITGLPSGDYMLRETKAPSGHIIQTSEIYFTVNTSGTGDVITVTEGKAPFNSDSIGAYTEGAKKDTLIIPNTPGTPLPQTGGTGTALFTALGGLMTATAGAILILTAYRRRKQHP